MGVPQEVCVTRAMHHSGWWFLFVAAVSCVLTLIACTPAAPTDTQATAEAPVAEAVYRGAAIAGQVCAQCHAIGGAGPQIHAGAPTFRSVVENPATTAESLTTWLNSSHPTMPHYLFPENDVADLVAYILSLRHKPQPV